MLLKPILWGNSMSIPNFMALYQIAVTFLKSETMVYFT